MNIINTYDYYVLIIFNSFTHIFRASFIHSFLINILYFNILFILFIRNPSIIVGGSAHLFKG